jgi:hypothetical protein
MGSQSKPPRRLLVGAIFSESLAVDECIIDLQKHSLHGGYTDIEARAGNRWHFVLEAKRGWEVPSKDQLSLYSARLTGANAAAQRLVTLSAADGAFAAEHLPDKIDEIAITHLSWTDILRLSHQAQAVATAFDERLWMRQLVEHLQEFVSMDRTIGNTVYVVSLSDKPMVEGKDHTWIDVVEKDQCYFHPVGNHWPVEAPNYLGFRNYGKLQSVHHVDSFAVVRDLANVNGHWPKTDMNQFVYRLGPRMRPPMDMRASNVLRSRRVECAIDTLLSGEYKTLSDATNETKRRLAKP